MKYNYNPDVIDDLKRSINVEEHLSFANNLLNKYFWKEERRKSFKTSLDLISKKHKDTRLYLGIVGEFSTGKSTLINALIGDDILKTDVLQATTATATLICYGDKLDVEVEYLNGNKIKYRNSLPLLKRLWRQIFKPRDKKMKKEILEFIIKVTADENIAKDIATVTIKHPAKVLKDGLVIIDTPGTNVNNERHENITKNVIRDICDATVIITPSNAPIPQSCLNFLQGNLEDLLSRCIFLLNKMDLLNPKERERIIKYTKNRLENSFNIPSVVVLPFTPIILLCDKLKKNCDLHNSPEDMENLLEESYNTECEIHSILREQRILIQLQKLVILINNMFIELENDLKGFEASYNEKHLALEKNKIKNLSLFVTEEKRKHNSDIKNKAMAIQNEMRHSVEIAKAELIKGINEEIYKINKKQNLNTFMKKRLKVLIQSNQDKLQGNLWKEFEKFKVIGTQQISIFEKEFERIYKSLETLGGKININEKGLQSKTASTLNKATKKNLSTIKGEVNAYNGKVVAASVGGAYAGAAIGTIILPVIGTAIGAFVGVLAGKLFSKPLSELQDNYFNHIKKEIDNSFNDVINLVNSSCDNAISSVISDMNNIIDAYFTEYNSLINEMIKRDEDEKLLLKEKSKIIKGDLNQLANRKQTLEDMSKKLLRL